jgi:hypothetical protein
MKMEEPTIDQLWQAMRKAQQNWDLAVGELKDVISSSDNIPSSDGDLVLHRVRGREIEAAQKYATAVGAYSSALLRKR